MRDYVVWNSHVKEWTSKVIRLPTSELIHLIELATLIELRNCMRGAQGLSIDATTGPLYVTGCYCLFILENYFILAIFINLIILDL